MVISLFNDPVVVQARPRPAKAARTFAFWSSRAGEVGLHIASSLAGEGHDLVVVDWNAPYCEFALTFLQERPGVPVLCLDMNCSKVIVLSSRSYTAANSEDLVQIVRDLLAKTEE